MKMRKTIKLAVSVLFLASLAQASVIIKPISVTETSAAAVYVDWSFDAVIDGSGLSEPLNTGDTVPASMPTHEVGYWINLGRYWSWDITLGELTFDLGGLFSVNGVVVWNYAEFWDNLAYSDKGMSSFTVSFSADGVNFNNPVTVTPAQVPHLAAPDPYDPNTFTVAPIQATHVRFSNFNWFNTIEPMAGLAEVRFTGNIVSPVVQTQPDSVTVAIGEPASFAVEAINALNYQWFKNGAAISGATQPTLNFASATLADEGSYYCRLSNGTAQINTRTVRLSTERLVAHWGFEGNLTDSVANWDGTLYAPNTFGEFVPASEPNYAAGVAGGQALEFFNDARHIRIMGSDNAFNFYPQGLTVNCWIKTASHPDWMAIITKQNDTGWDSGFVLNTHFDGVLEFLIPSIRGTFDGPWANVTISDDTWHMVTMTWDGSFSKIYYDGQLAVVSVEYTDPSELPVSTSPVVIGADRPDGTFPFIGLLDEMSVYNYAIDHAAIARLYTDVETNASICIDPDELAFDANDDCVIDMIDFSAFAAKWMDCNRVAGSASAQVNCMP